MEAPAYFKQARDILAEDAQRGLTSTFSEKLSLYRMCRCGMVVWRCSVSIEPPRGISFDAPRRVRLKGLSLRSGEGTMIRSP